jgi:hypothetical protein
MAGLMNENGVVHVRYGGRSLDVVLSDLDLGPRAGDAEVKRALARHLDVAEGILRDSVVDRHETGNMTVRPEAVFG